MSVLSSNSQFEFLECKNFRAGVFFCQVVFGGNDNYIPLGQSLAPSQGLFGIAAGQNANIL